jgi:hypothetical protein
MGIIAAAMSQDGDEPAGTPAIDTHGRRILKPDVVRRCRSPESAQNTDFHACARYN